MASNTPRGSWRVKIASIPVSITVTQLSETLGLPSSHIYIPKANKGITHYAWVDHFVDEEEANKFARQWSGSSILGETIKCVAAAPRNDERDVLHSSRQPLVSAVGALPKKQHHPQFNREPKGRQDNSNPPTTAMSLMSLTTARAMNDTINADDENELQKPPPLLNRFHQRPNQPQQHYTSNQVLEQMETSGKFIYTKN